MKRCALPIRLLVLVFVIVGLTRPMHAQEVIPAQAIGKDTMLAMFVDVTQIDAEQLQQMGEVLVGVMDQLAQLQGEDAALPLGDPQQVVDSLITLRGSFIEAGGEGLMMTLEMPGEESWSPPMSLLARTNGKFNADAMAALLRTMGQGQMEASISSLGDGWQNLVMKSKEGDQVTRPLPAPDAKVFQAFSKQLSQHKKPVMAVAFRMQEQMREMMDLAEEAAKNAQPGPEGDAQQQMAMGMMMGMFKPIRSLDTLGLAVSQLDDGMLVDVQMTFLDAQNAQMFANLYNSILMFAPVLMAQAGQGQAENMPDPATINQFFMKLRMQVAGDSLKLTLDQEFFDLAEKLAPLFEGLQDQALPGPDL